MNWEKRERTKELDGKWPNLLLPSTTYPVRFLWPLDPAAAAVISLAERKVMMVLSGYYVPRDGWMSSVSNYYLSLSILYVSFYSKKKIYIDLLSFSRNQSLAACRRPGAGEADQPAAVCISCLSSSLQLYKAVNPVLSWISQLFTHQLQLVLFSSYTHTDTTYYVHTHLVRTSIAKRRASFSHYFSLFFFERLRIRL